MKQRRISVLAIAGLTSVAMAVTPAAVPNTALLSAAVADAQVTAAPNFTAGPAEIKNGAEGTFTVNVPSPEANSKVQFFLDNVAVGTVNVSGGNASIKIKPTSYGSHNVIARYVDPQGFNPRADVTRSFNTPMDLLLVDKGPGRDDANDTYKSQVNGRAGTVANPVVVQPGSDVTLTANMVVNNGRFSLPTRVYEMGINPPVGAEFKSATRTDDGAKIVTARGKAGGTASFTGQGTHAGTSWGKSGNPKVNPGYFGINVNDLYYVRDIEIKGTFKAPTAPGIYVPQHAYYKFATNQTHYLRRMDNAVFRVAEPKLPERKQRTNSSAYVVADQKFVAKQPKDLEIAVTPSNVSGTVTVKHGDTTIASNVTVSSGKAVAKNVTFDEPGTKELTVDFTSETAGVNNSTGTGSVTVAEPAAKTEVELTVPEYSVVGDFTPLKAKVSPAAAGRIDFYDGQTLLDGADVDDDGNASVDAVLENEGDRTIRAVFIPDDTEKHEGSEMEKPLKVYAEEPQAEVNEPEAKPNPAPVVIGSEEPKPEDYLANADDLPAGTKYEWKTKPDFTKEGEQEATVVVTYPDGTVDEVKVTVTVEKPKETSSTPTTTSSTTTSATTSTSKPADPKPSTSTSSATTSTSKPAEPKPSTSTSTTTSTTSAEPKPSTTSTKPSTSATSAKPVPKKSDAETYTPEPKADHAEIDGDKGVPQPIEFIDNAGDLPGGTVFEWKKAPDVTKDGDQEVVISVTYPDGTTDEAKVTVPVKAKTAKPTTTTTAPTSTKSTDTPTSKTSTTAPTTTKKDSSGSGENDGSSTSSKIEGSSVAQRTALYAIIGILLSLLGIAGGFGLWQNLMGQHR